MNHDLWTAVDGLIAEHLLPHNPVLDAVLTAKGHDGFAFALVTAL